MARARDLYVGTTVRVTKSQRRWHTQEPVNINVGDIGTIIDGPAKCLGAGRYSRRGCYFEVKFWTGEKFHFFPYELEIVA